MRLGAEEAAVIAIAIMGGLAVWWLEGLTSAYTYIHSYKDAVVL